LKVAATIEKMPIKVIFIYRRKDIDLQFRNGSKVLKNFLLSENKCISWAKFRDIYWGLHRYCEFKFLRGHVCALGVFNRKLSLPKTHI